MQPSPHGFGYRVNRAYAGFVIQDVGSEGLRGIRAHGFKAWAYKGISSSWRIEKEVQCSMSMHAELNLPTHPPRNTSANFGGLSEHVIGFHSRKDVFSFW